MAAAADRQISCLFVRFNTTLFFTFVRSFGTLTNAIKSHAGATYPLQAAQFSDFSFPLFSCNFPISRELSTSFPHTSQPGDCCLANNSIRGRSPISFTIRSLASAAFYCVPLHGKLSPDEHQQTAALESLSLQEGKSPHLHESSIPYPKTNFPISGSV